MLKKLLLCFFAASSAQVLAEEIDALPPLTIYSQSNAELVEPARMQDEFDREKLQAAEMPDLNNVLKNQAGLVLTQTNPQMMGGFSLRGASGAGQGLFTLDGVPLYGSLAGLFTLSHYPADALGNVTLTRGAGGDKHGSRTLGGGIHLKTREFQSGDNFFHFEGGSYDTLRETAGGGISTDVGDFSAVAGRTDILSGISQARDGVERDNYDMTHASGNWKKNFDHAHLNASLYFVRSDENMDGPAILPNRTVGWSDDKKGQLLQETWVSQLRGDYDLTDYWNSSLQLGFTQNRQTSEATLIKPFELTAQLFMVDWKNTHRLPLDAKNKNQAQFTWGVNTQHQNTPNVVGFSQTIISPNVRGELVLGAWELAAEGRFDHGDDYGNHQVFALSANRAVTSTLNVWANGGTGYRQPGLTELLNPTYGDKNLRGESSAGGEIGLTWKPLPESELKISGYYQNYQDLIVLQLNPKTGVSKTANVNESDVFGAQFQASHHWSKIWETGLNYGYMDARNAQTHLKIAIRPEHQGVFWNEIKLLDPLKLRVELNARSSYFFDGANTRQSDSAPRFNALLKYQLTPKTELYLRGENLNNNRSPELGERFNFNGTSVYAGFRTGF
ncbi:MAG: TonB-dependent receptor plug domain-containing protein [Methylococcales bacterium]|nr:TonB-dependent receptor plug domain-containing protein [Methylococcales bacterium]